jgi:hypothetical protein
MRKTIELVARLCERTSLSQWRQHMHAIKKLKKLYRHAQQAKRARTRTVARTERCEKEVWKSYRSYISESTLYLTRAKETIEEAKQQGKNDIASTAIIFHINNYILHAERQIDQIERRVFKGETIPHDEKVFSLFEPHSEWISKGKAGVPQELGLKVCIIEDRRGFILNHRIMKHEHDVDAAVPFLKATKALYPNLLKCSFDKGFHSPTNKKELAQILDMVILPKKGKRSAVHQAEESAEEFVVARNKHSGVESAINGLQNHGLDRCLDHGLHGFERYVSLAVLARNIQNMGAILMAKEKEEKKTREDKRSRKSKAA